MRKGQSGAELLIILAVGLVVLGFVISTSQQRLGSSQAALAFSIARASANDLANAADAVYVEGVGARRQVAFTLPEGTLATSMTSNSISIRVSSQDGFSDAAANTQADLCADSVLPGKPGRYSVAVESLDTCVAIGASSNLTVSTTLISVISFPGTSLLRSLNYSNLGTNPILVNLNLSFDSPDVLVEFLDPADDAFTLNGGGSKEVQLNITLSSLSLGAYSGLLLASGSNGENLSTSIIVEAASQGCQQQSCPSGSSPIAEIEIKTFSSGSYSEMKEIFDPSEEILIRGGEWDPLTSLTLDVRDPTDAFSLTGYPKNLQTNSSGGFNDTLLSAGLGSLSGYIIRASGLEGGIPAVKTGNFNILACT